MTEEMKHMTFDEAYRELTKTVNALEARNIDFNESLVLYEHACELVVLCRKRLGELKGKMTDIHERVRKLSQTEALIPDEED